MKKLNRKASDLSWTIEDLEVCYYKSLKFPMDYKTWTIYDHPVFYGQYKILMFSVDKLRQYNIFRFSIYNIRPSDLI